MEVTSFTKTLAARRGAAGRERKGGARDKGGRKERAETPGGLILRDIARKCELVGYSSSMHRLSRH